MTNVFTIIYTNHMLVPLDGFDWDDANREKCAKHGVSRREIERLFEHQPAIYPDPEHSRTETRFRAIGRVDDRYVFAVFTLREMDGQRMIRPISARFMHAKEIRHYEQQKASKATSGTKDG